MDVIMTGLLKKVTYALTYYGDKTAFRTECFY